LDRMQSGLVSIKEMRISLCSAGDIECVVVVGWGGGTVLQRLGLTIEAVHSLLGK
jgi:hypothetical protein